MALLKGTLPNLTLTLITVSCLFQQDGNPTFQKILRNNHVTTNKNGSSLVLKKKKKCIELCHGPQSENLRTTYGIKKKSILMCISSKWPS